MQLFLNCEQQNLEDSTEVMLMLHITRRQELYVCEPGLAKGKEWKENQGHRVGKK